jgi:hypothetical protein
MGDKISLRNLFWRQCEGGDCFRILLLRHYDSRRGS